MRSVSIASLLFLLTQSPSAPAPLPNQADSFKFVVLGNSGTGEPAQYELAGQMAALRDRFKYDLVLLLGGNVQGDSRPVDFVKKFETPYKRLLDGSVAFHAVIGDEDSREQRYYKNFNMKGKPYYAFEPRPELQFIALDSTDVTKEQLDWVAATLKGSTSAWKIVFLHHPLYSSGRPGSNLRLRAQLEPLFIMYNVSAVLSAHDHVYERIRLQNGIAYFVVGSGGNVRQGDINRTSGITASGFDTDLAFLAAEIAGDQMHFNAISRTGETVDSGVIARRK
jgi:3',5'-cyclic AMP phosphodiesterase CpdA